MPDSFLFHAIVFYVSFLIVWAGSGLAIGELAKLASSLKISRFTLSFFLLGILTSIPEMSIGINALALNDPSIIVGNLLGGVIVMFLLIIPLLALVGNGVRIPKEMQSKNILLPLLVIIAPVFFLLDGVLSPSEGIFIILIYVLLFIFFVAKAGLVAKLKSKTMKRGNGKGKRLIKIGVGLVLIFLASNQIVNSTEYLASALNWSPFLVSLLLVSIGTNIPELSFVFRSIVSKKQDIAMADYVGSAAANSLLFGVFAVVSQTSIEIPSHFLLRFLFITLGLGLFTYFARSHKHLNRVEGAVLIGIYIMFFMSEILIS